MFALLSLSSPSQTKHPDKPKWEQTEEAQIPILPLIDQNLAAEVPLRILEALDPADQGHLPGPCRGPDQGPLSRPGLRCPLDPVQPPVAPQE